MYLCLCIFYLTNEDIRFFVSWGKCAGQRYGTANGRVGHSATAQLLRVGGDSWHGSSRADDQADETGGGGREMERESPVDEGSTERREKGTGADREKRVRGKVSSTSVVIGVV